MKLFSFVAMGILISFVSCEQAQSKTEETKEVKHIQYPIGIRTFEIYHGEASSFVFSGKILSCTNDTVVVEAPSSHSQIKISIIIPTKKQFPINSTINVEAEIWGGGYEGDWIYSIK